MRFLYRVISAKTRWWMLFDMLMALVAIKLACIYAPKALPHEVMLSQILFLPIFVLIAGNITGVYEHDVFVVKIKLFTSILLTILLAIIALSLFSNIFLYKQIGRYILLLMAIILLISCGGVRFLCYFLGRTYRIKLLFIGRQGNLSYFTRKMRQSNSRYILTGFCHDDPVLRTNKLGSINDITRICQDHNIDIAVIGDDYINNPHILDKYFIVRQKRCSFMDEETFIEHAFEQVCIDKIDPSWFYKGNMGIHSDLQVFVKRLLDIVIAVIGLALVGLFFPFVWIFIRFTSKGPILYSQERCGRFGKAFKIYKFRTMKVDSEINGAQWAKRRDNRVTFIGRILRKTRLDEIPQFWNILTGDMSLVGPRPERPALVRKIEREIPYFYFRHWVKPGITGFAQIRYRYGANIEDAREKLKYDLYYIKNWSILMDFQIILRTVATIMKGAY